MSIIRHLKDRIDGKVPAGSKRSGHWPKVRADHLGQHPTCAVCGGKTKLEVHHIRPFHLHPELELDPKNLITLCEAGSGGVNCHLHFGHLGNYKSFNADAPMDADTWAKKIKGRP